MSEIGLSAGREDRRWEIAVCETHGPTTPTQTVDVLGKPTSEVHCFSCQGPIEWVEVVPVAALERCLDELMLHDNTGDPLDEGYMRALHDVRAALEPSSDADKSRPPSVPGNGLAPGEADHTLIGRTHASLDVMVYNGPSLWLKGEHLTTEEACSFLAAHLPLREQSERSPAALEVVSDNDQGRTGNDEPTLEDECHFALWQEMHSLIRSDDGNGEKAHKLAVMAYRFYAERGEAHPIENESGEALSPVLEPVSDNDRGGRTGNDEALKAMTAARDLCKRQTAEAGKCAQKLQRELNETRANLDKAVAADNAKAAELANLRRFDKDADCVPELPAGLPADVAHWPEHDAAIFDHAFYAGVRHGSAVAGAERDGSPPLEQVSGEERLSTSCNGDCGYCRGTGKVEPGEFDVLGASGEHARCRFCDGTGRTV